MANPKPVLIDGEVVRVPENSKLGDLVPGGGSVVTSDGRLISGKALENEPLPAGFSLNHTGVSKGGL